MTPEQQAAFDAWREACRAYEDANTKCDTANAERNRADEAASAAFCEYEDAGKARRIAREAFEALLGATS